MQTNHVLIDLGSIAAFERYEWQVASWLKGEKAPALTEGFDVWRCADCPQLTFQVKHANIYHFGGRAVRQSSQKWVFNQSKLNGGTPDYFVLFGVDDDGSEHCFLLSKAQFKEHSSKNATGGRIMTASPNRAIRRGKGTRSYMYEPFLWRYEVQNPEVGLRQRVLEMESWKQTGLL